MASKFDLTKDELIGRAARLRGVSPEKFIEDVRRISNGRGMCAHSRDYFFRPSNVRTLSETARPEKGSRDRMDQIGKSFEHLLAFGEDADVHGYNDRELAEWLETNVIKSCSVRLHDKDYIIRAINRARASSYMLSMFVDLLGCKYLTLVGQAKSTVVVETVREKIGKVKPRRSVIDLKPLESIAEANAREELRQIKMAKAKAKKEMEAMSK